MDIVFKPLSMVLLSENENKTMLTIYVFARHANIVTIAS